MLVAIIAVIGLILLYKGTFAGQATYQQYTHRPVVFVPEITCEQVQCDEGQAYLLRIDRLTGNPICSCPNGKTFQVSGRASY